MKSKTNAPKPTHRSVGAGLWPWPREHDSARSGRRTAGEEHADRGRGLGVVTLGASTVGSRSVVPTQSRFTIQRRPESEENTRFEGLAEPARIGNAHWAENTSRPMDTMAQSVDLHHGPQRTAAIIRVRTADHARRDGQSFTEDGRFNVYFPIM